MSKVVEPEVLNLGSPNCGNENAIDEVMSIEWEDSLTLMLVHQTIAEVSSERDEQPINRL